MDITKPSIEEQRDKLINQALQTPEGKKALSAAVMGGAQSLVEEVCHYDGIDAKDLEKLESEFKKACQKVLATKQEEDDKGEVIGEF